MIDLNLQAMIYDHNQRLKEYRETLGMLPTDIPEKFAEIIVNPSSKSKIKLSISCLRYLEEKYNFLEKKAEMMSTEQKRIWYENFRRILGNTSGDYDSYNQYCQNLIHTFPNVMSEMKVLIQNSILLDVLTNPMTFDDVFLCQKYTDYLYNQVKYVRKKSEYMDNLNERENIICDLKKTGKYQQLLEILLDPKSDIELKFCISYFKLQDSLKTIEEEAREGKSKPSSTADLVRVIAPHIFHPQKYLENQENDCIADLLYSIAAAQVTDYKNLIVSLSQKHMLYPREDITETYHEFITEAQENLINGISRKNPSLQDDVDRFCSIQESFSKLTKCGNIYQPKAKNTFKTRMKVPNWISL